MKSLLPTNATDFERALETGLTRVESLEIPLRRMWNAELCPEEFLPWLAHSVGVDRWPEGYTVEQKRDAIRASVELYRKRGTLGALRRALEVEGYEYRINENSHGSFTFTLEFLTKEGAAAPREKVDALVEAVKLAKNERSHMTGVSVHHENKVDVRIGGIVAIESHTHVVFDVWQDHSMSRLHGGPSTEDKLKERYGTI